MRLVVISTNIIFKYTCYIIKCVKFGQIYIYFMNNYFPNGKCIMLQNYAWIKVPFKVQDFNVRNTKSLLICFHKSMLQLIFKKLPFIEFSFSRVATIIWKNLLKYSPFPIIYLFSQNMSFKKRYFIFS